MLECCTAKGNSHQGDEDEGSVGVEVSSDNSDMRLLARESLWGHVVATTIDNQVQGSKIWLNPMC